MAEHITQTFDAKKGRLMFTNTKTGKKGWSMEEVMESSNTPEIAARSSKSVHLFAEDVLACDPRLTLILQPGCDHKGLPREVSSGTRR